MLLLWWPSEGLSCEGDPVSMFETSHFEGNRDHIIEVRLLAHVTPLTGTSQIRIDLCGCATKKLLDVVFLLMYFIIFKQKNPHLHHYTILPLLPQCAGTIPSDSTLVLNPKHMKIQILFWNCEIRLHHVYL